MQLPLWAPRAYGFWGALGASLDHMPQDGPPDGINTPAPISHLLRAAYGEC